MRISSELLCRKDFPHLARQTYALFVTIGNRAQPDRRRIPELLDEKPTSHLMRNLIQRLAPKLFQPVIGGSKHMALQLTLLDVVRTVSEYAATDTEVVAIVVYLVNSGQVQLCGNFRGARFDLETVAVVAA